MWDQGVKARAGENSVGRLCQLRMLSEFTETPYNFATDED